MAPTVGRIVHYKLSETDVQRIWQHRAEQTGCHGNPVSPGEVVPMIIAVVWPNEYGENVPGVNGQAFLDGNDSLWVTSAKEGMEAGQWSWPEIKK